MSCLSSWHHIHNNHFFTVPDGSDHNLAHWQPLYEVLLSWRLGVLPIQVLSFHVQSRMKDPCSICCLLSRKRVLCPSASKYVKNSDEITFLLILSLTIRLQGILLMYTFDKMASARPFMELCFFCFVSNRSFCPVINHASAKHWREVCGCLPLILSLYNRNQHTLFVTHITDRLHFKCCCSGATYQRLLQLHT